MGLSLPPLNRTRATGTVSALAGQGFGDSNLPGVSLPQVGSGLFWRVGLDCGEVQGVIRLCLGGEDMPGLQKAVVSEVRGLWWCGMGRIKA